jgi:glycosyltransferase involved in cell wall biosynthesis
MLPSELLTLAGNPHGLARKIQTWYDAPLSARQEMGERLRAEAMRVNEPAKHVKKIVEVYQSLVKNMR